MNKYQELIQKMISKYPQYKMTYGPGKQPEIDICSECGEHTEFNEEGSECCGANPIDPDPDIDMER